MSGAQAGRMSLAGALRTVRQDLLASEHPALGEAGGAGAAFECCASRVREGDELRLEVQDEAGQVFVLARHVAQALPLDPHAAAARLLARPLAQAGLAQRLLRVDWPVLAGLVARHTQVLRAGPHDVGTHGPVPSAPTVSLVVCLSSALDGLELLLLRLGQDAWLREHAELVLVLDNPAQADALREQAPWLAALYHMPLRWVWGHARRGLAEAYTLGARVAQAPWLVFLNGAVWPTAPGWVQPLLAALMQDGVGAVAPVLERPDGTLDQAGLDYRWDALQQVWQPHAPQQGLARAQTLLPQGGQRVPLLGSACLAVHRTTLEALGGWDPHALLSPGWEGPTLSQALRAQGLACACVGTVRLTHVPEQAVPPAWREAGLHQRAEWLNSVWHHWRWAPAIETMVNAQEGRVA